MTFENVTREELLKNSKTPLRIVETEAEMYEDMAQVMFDAITENNAAGKNTVFIVPVGPIGQYRILAEKVNAAKTDLSHVYFINMDEYLDENDQPIPLEHPLSFIGFMNREWYDLVDMPKENRIFPEPGKEELIARRIEELGGVDISFGGVGINGHIAFNEPPEQDEDMTDEEFAALPTRVLSLTRETRTINSVTAANGYIDYIPKRCITVGMKDILSAKKIRFYMNRTWQKGIARKITLGPVSRFAPASFFQQHPDASITLVSYVAEPPVGELH
ncbi:MAG: glucosamine-6-phosphate isomerase [Oscillospiraceae bacterium]|nr:glucosamine-6-phosphate isomerase [Oscillospiraceae bacterium]